MAGSATIDGNNVIITFTYSPQIANGQNVIDLVSQGLFIPTGNVTWDQLTNQQKLDIVDAEISRHIKQLATMQRNDIGKAMASDVYPIDL